MNWLKRCLDVVAAAALLAMLFPLLALIALSVRLTSRGPAIYWSKRVGQFEKLFWMPKFRTMQLDTPTVATHQLENPNQFLTPIGGVLRKTSLDELPQLWCILNGNMSLVGPRPALFNQVDLIALRREQGIDALVPGLTGWAQINGRDEIPVPLKVQLDAEYLRRHTFMFDLQILLLTAKKVLLRENITH
jgi:O-antigen biosynthesis protein WbqP